MKPPDKPEGQGRHPDLPITAAPVTEQNPTILQAGDDGNGQAEYRVTWRRAGWSETTKNKTRTFARAHDADRFAQRLRTPFGELTPATVSVAWRYVGAWQEVPGGWASL